MKYLFLVFRSNQDWCRMISENMIVRAQKKFMDSYTEHYSAAGFTVIRVPIPSERSSGEPLFWQYEDLLAEYAGE